MSKYSEYRNIVSSFVSHCISAGKPVVGKPRWLEQEGTINVVCVRNNEELSTNKIKRNNDELFVFENRPNDCYRLYEFPCTADPRGWRHRIAHLSEGAYESYLIRPHNWTPGRTALGQDANDVVVLRTDTKGNLIKKDRGKFGINVHDANRFWNSSLGCIVIAYSLQWQYSAEFKPLLQRAAPVYRKLIKQGLVKGVSLFLINHSTLSKI